SLPATSSPSSSANSDALAVHPDHRSSDASQTLSHSTGLRKAPNAHSDFMESEGGAVGRNTAGRRMGGTLPETFCRPVVGWGVAEGGRSLASAPHLRTAGMTSTPPPSFNKSNSR